VAALIFTRLGQVGTDVTRPVALGVVMALARYRPLRRMLLYLDILHALSTCLPCNWLGDADRSMRSGTSPPSSPPDHSDLTMLALESFELLLTERAAVAAFCATSALRSVLSGLRVAGPESLPAAVRIIGRVAAQRIGAVAIVHANGLRSTLRLLCAACGDTDRTTSAGDGCDLPLEAPLQAGTTIGEEMVDLSRISADARLGLFRIAADLSGLAETHADFARPRALNAVLSPLRGGPERLVPPCVYIVRNLSRGVQTRARLVRQCTPWLVPRLIHIAVHGPALSSRADALHTLYSPPPPKHARNACT
jgi:hypothetical protein